MHEEVGTGTKMAVTMIIVVSIISLVVSINVMSMAAANNVVNKLDKSMNIDYADEIRTMANLAEPLPAPSIYLSISKYGFDNLAQFDMSIGGITSTDPDFLTKNFDKQLYVKLVVTTDGLHVWVGDYY